MTTTLHSAGVRAALEHMFAAAELDETVSVPIPASASAQERADLLENLYLPISPRGGDLLYSLVRASRPETVVEFGTSFGISTMYLAAAVADNGTGHVYGTEMSATKIRQARANLDDAAVGEHVTLLEGDALETLAAVNGPIGLVLLDGWKDLCLPVLRLLEPRLLPGALVVADDSTFAAMADYLAYVREPANGYVTVDFPVEDGMEISCRALTA